MAVLVAIPGSRQRRYLVGLYVPWAWEGSGVGPTISRAVYRFRGYVYDLCGVGPNIALRLVPVYNHALDQIVGTWARTAFISSNVFFPSFVSSSLANDCPGCSRSTSNDLKKPSASSCIFIVSTSSSNIF